jgi:4-oxalocrotonate tautomerase
MPTITVEGPPVEDVEVKRRLAKGLADVAASAYGLPAEIMVVLIKENPPDNVGIGGELLSDRKKA